MADAGDNINIGENLQYLMQMAEELKKLAQSAGAPSLALLFDMANDEARAQLTARQAAAEYAAAEQRRQNAVRPSGSVLADWVAVRRRSIRHSRHHAAIMADKSAGKFKFHQTKI